MNALNLASCVALSSLEITLPVYTASGKLTDAKVPYTAPNNLPGFLSSAPPTLRAVTFRLQRADRWVSQISMDFNVAVRIIEDALIDLIDERGLRTVTVLCERGLELTVESGRHVVSLVPRLYERKVVRIASSELAARCVLAILLGSS